MVNSLLNATRRPLVESPDLGAFTFVFHALNDLQPRTFIPHGMVAATATSIATETTTTDSLTESESDRYIRGSTVWTQQPIASYLSISSRTATTRLSMPSPSPPPTEPPPSDTDTEGEMMDQDANSGDYEDSSHADEMLPSLGSLDEALQFIAAERAKLTAPRDNSWQRGNSSNTSDDPQQHHLHPLHHHLQQQQHKQLAPRRRRRNKKARPIAPTILVRESSGAVGDDNQPRTATQDVEDPSDLSSPNVSSSEAAVRFRSTPGSPSHQAGRRNSIRSASLDRRPRLGHSKSTPTLRPGPLDPRVVRLRALAIKLKFLFSAEAELLTGVLANDSLQSSSPDFIDPRGPPPRPGQPLIHVFID